MQVIRHIPGMLNEAITLIARLYDRIDALEAEKKTAAEQFETQLKAVHETPPEQPSMFPSNAAPKVRTMTVIRRVPTKT